MGIGDIIDAAEAVGARDEERQTAFREEFAAYEAGETDGFPRTREALAAERAALDSLADELDAEAGNIEELAEESAFLSADQAVRHRDQTVEKLEAHNERLREFHDAMTAALGAVGTNLDALAAEGSDAIDADPEPQFERAHDALEAHNEAVEGLGTNLTILNAYLR
ncbi:hypothetical protein [Halolamina sp.]|jgi:ElaB/YqjD/DUF883 family membrane-anchored ribosome-binding protein|uniref:hypothetical protein n=1 Tax=Halolamina sp. TaxID=1940283 RepID=UPI003565B9A4